MATLTATPTPTALTDRGYVTHSSTVSPSIRHICTGSSNAYSGANINCQQHHQTPGAIATSNANRDGNRAFVSDTSDPPDLGRLTDYY